MKALLLSAILSDTTFISVGLIRPVTVPGYTAEECMAENIALCSISKNNSLGRRMVRLDNSWRHS